MDVGKRDLLAEAAKELERLQKSLEENSAKSVHMTEVPGLVYVKETWRETLGHSKWTFGHGNDPKLWLGTRLKIDGTWYRTIRAKTPEELKRKLMLRDLEDRIVKHIVKSTIASLGEEGEDGKDKVPDEGMDEGVDDGGGQSEEGDGQTSRESKKERKKRIKEERKKRKEEEPESERTTKWRGKELQKEVDRKGGDGRDARRKAHDKKKKGEPDRGKKQNEEDYDPDNY